MLKNSKESMEATHFKAWAMERIEFPFNNIADTFGRSVWEGIV